jgi:two-component system cell cycle response regulator DivK
MKLVRDVLRFHGYRTVEATSGEEGVALAVEHRPALILMDIALPGIDGVEATRRLKAEPLTATIPVVALTASLMQSDRTRFDDAGFEGLIPKPIDVLTFPDQVLAFSRQQPTDA